MHPFVDVFSYWKRGEFPFLSSLSSVGFRSSSIIQKVGEVFLIADTKLKATKKKLLGK